MRQSIAIWLLLSTIDTINYYFTVGSAVLKDLRLAQL